MVSSEYEAGIIYVLAVKWAGHLATMGYMLAELGLALTSFIYHEKRRWAFTQWVTRWHNG